MANSSIHIATGGAGYFAHNSRESKTTNSIFKDEKNYCSCSKDEAFKIYRSELEKRSEAYSNRTGQKLQKKAITHLSAIVNFEQNHNEKDIKKVCDYLEEKFDTKVIQFSLHRDEGHIDENGTAIKNYHAHIEMMGLDSEGKSVRKKLTRKSLSNMQTDVAKLLEMERGRNFNKEFKEFKNGERDTMPTKAKRLDTYEYKAHKKDEAKQILAKNKDLKEEITKLRATLQEQGGKREDYAKIEQLNKDLKAQIKSKDLTIEDLQAKFQEYKNLQRENKQLQSKVNVSQKHINKLQERNDTLIEEISKKEPKSDLNANMSDFDNKQAMKETKDLINEHITKQTVYKKEIEKGFLKEKEVYTPTEKTVIAEPNTFFTKVKQMTTISTKYLRDKYEILKTEVKDLKEKLFEAKEENSLYKEVAEETNRLNKRYVELSSKKDTELTDSQRVEKIRLAKELTKPFSQRMREFDTQRRVDEGLERPSEAMEERKKSLEQLQAKLNKQEPKEDYKVNSIPDEKSKYEKVFDKINERYDSMSAKEQKYANEYAHKVGIAKIMKKEIPPYEYQEKTQSKSKGRQR